jgi:three-Cys-motif partner protein
MAGKDFHSKAFDAGTTAKLGIFELYAQEWIPVFVSPADPAFKRIDIFDFFCGPGTDSQGNHGSPLRILGQLSGYHQQGMAGWEKVKIVVHFFDDDEKKIAQLLSTLNSPEWQIPGVTIDCRVLKFHDALAEHEAVLRDRSTAKLLIIDQFGVDQVSDTIFGKLISFQTTDFIFFLSSSTLHRFREHPAIKQKIERPEDSYDVHRAAVDYYRKLIPADNAFYLAPFSIRKGSNIYGLIFGSRHPLGIHKFLEVAWRTDEIAGEANFDIERSNINPGEGILPLDLMRPNKVVVFEDELESALRKGVINSEADLIRFCIEAGMTCSHSETILKKLKGKGVITADFRVPNIKNLKRSRAIRLTK